MLNAHDKDYLRSTDENEKNDCAKYFGRFAPILTWDTSRNLNRKTFQGLLAFALYNRQTNGVDLRDQRINVNVASRKEERFFYFKLSFLLDLGKSSTYSIYLLCVKIMK